MDNSLPYQFKDNYKDTILKKKASKESLRSISDRSSLVNSKFKLKYVNKHKKIEDYARKDYVFQSIEERIK